MATNLQVIEEKLKNFENKYNSLKNSIDQAILSEIENAIKSIQATIKEAKSQKADEADITLGSLKESVDEIEDYINTL